MKQALLALETATDVCGVAVHDGTRVVASFTIRQRQQHARALVPLVAEALRYLPGGWNDVGAVAVSSGPGSYTGLRIGASVAKGFCSARDLTLVAVPSLDALAAQMTPFAQPDDAIGAAFNSRRGEVYVAWFGVMDERLRPLRPPEACTIADAVTTVPDADRHWLVGEGAPLLASVLSGRDITVVPPGVVAPDPAWIARLGFDRRQAGHLEDVAVFEPDYLKPFVAREAAAAS